MDEPSKDYAPTDAVVDGVSLGTFQSPFLAAAREEQELISRGAPPDDAHQIVNNAHGWRN